MAVKGKAAENEHREEITEMPKQEVKEEKGTFVYIGPSLPVGRINSNKVFIGTRQEIEKELEEAVKQYPLVEHMLVPVGRLAEKKEKVKAPGNILNNYYSAIASGIAAKGGV